MPIATIIDLKRSTKKFSIEQWKSIYGALEEELRAIRKNMAYKDGIISGPQIVAGDSIEILTTSCIPTMQTIHAVMSITKEIRIGVGVGPVTYVDKEDINKTTGLAFKLASEAIADAKSKNTIIIVKTHEKYDEDELRKVLTIAIYAILLSKIRQEAIKYSYEFIWKRASITQIAQKYGKKSSTITNVLKASQMKEIRNIIELALQKGT